MQGARLEPLGASDDRDDEAKPSWKECQQCTCLEEEKETLQTSLFALTTHFAQVQFRLRQVCDAPLEEQEELLKSLEKFAFTDLSLNVFDDDVMEVVKKWRHQQKLLVKTLKAQVRELKNFDVVTTKNEVSLDLLLEHLQVKENVEKQLRTQIEDLERFIEYSKSDKCVCKQSEKRLKDYITEILDTGFSFLQMFFMVQFTWGCFTVSAGITHWGDLRAKLELAIINLKKMLRSKENPKNITLAIRRNLATSIRDLMQHGTKSHSWDIILYYYNLRKGDEFNSSPIQKLSRSFNIKIANVCPHKNKKNFLYTIEYIVSMHSRYKRNNDAHFKAFICAALNARRLVTWLDLIVHCSQVIKTFYYPWSYVATTRYEDGLRSLNLLTKYKFDLPVDLEVQKFHIEDTVFV